MTFRDFPYGSEAYAAELLLRERVLREPLGLKLTAEDRAKDSGSFHLGGFDGKTLIGVLLLDPVEPGTLKMRQVAVDFAHQGTGAGRSLLAFAESFAWERGFGKFVAHARELAVPFYKKCGYEVAPDTFFEIGIPHRLVWKNLLPLSEFSAAT